MKSLIINLLHLLLKKAKTFIDANLPILMIVGGLILAVLTFFFISEDFGLLLLVLMVPVSIAISLLGSYYE